MKKNLTILFLSVCSLSFSLSAQSLDTLRVMTYNLMYYREFTSFCTSNNNDPSSKDGYMETIIDYALPDILVVNELGGSNAALNSFRLLSNALNQNGRSYYSLTNSNSNGNLANMLYFNSNKVVKKSQTTISQDLNNQSLIRLIDLYTLYYNDPSLAQHQDTAFIHVFAAHLKAGSSNSDEQERAKATEAVMDYLDQNNLDGNILFAGDLNLYNSNELAYQDLLNYSNQQYRFYDPINISGNWGNSAYAFLHTQSTHTSGGCFAGGGMDDRFDFILASDEIMNNTNRVSYINNSYKALGQDGNRYNGTLISPTNNSAPASVINALYNMSDHLPVMLDLQIDPPNSTNLSEINREIDFSFQNPNQGNLELVFGKNGDKVVEIALKSISGNIIDSWKHDRSNKSYRNISSLPNGVYFLYLRMINGNQSVEKLIKI